MQVAAQQLPEARSHPKGCRHLMSTNPPMTQSLWRWQTPLPPLHADVTMLLLQYCQAPRLLGAARASRQPKQPANQHAKQPANQSSQRAKAVSKPPQPPQKHCRALLPQLAKATPMYTLSPNAEEHIKSTGRTIFLPSA